MASVEDINILQERLEDAVSALEPFDNDMFGVREIRANLGQSIRYIGKLTDELQCGQCKEDISGPCFYFYKQRMHESCREALEERIGSRRKT